MAFTYLSTAPGSSDRSYIRLRIGDHKIASYQFEDEEIDAILGVYSNRLMAAAYLAESLAATNANKSDKSVGRLRISSAQASQHYMSLANRLRLEASLSATGFAGGISVSDKADREADTDREKPAFSVGQFDNPDSLTAESTAVF